MKAPGRLGASARRRPGVLLFGSRVTRDGAFVAPAYEPALTQGPQPAPADQLRVLLRSDIYRELVELLLGYARRARGGRTVPETVLVGLVLSRRTGEVIAIDAPRRVGE